MSIEIVDAIVENKCCVLDAVQKRNVCLSCGKT